MPASKGACGMSLSTSPKNGARQPCTVHGQRGLTRKSCKFVIANRRSEEYCTGRITSQAGPWQHGAIPPPTVRAFGA